MATILTKENFEIEVLGSDKKVLIDFWADWCAPCKMIAPTIEELALELADQVKVCKLNVDDERELAQSFNIMSIPTLVVVENQEVKSTMVGVQSKESILKLLEV